MPRSAMRRFFRHGMFPQLMVFEAVARLGSVTRAAAALHLAQPTVSTQLKKLQQSLDVTLFAAQGRGLQLTAAGRELQQACGELFEVIGRMADRLDALRKPAPALLRVAAVPSARRSAARLLAEFCARNHARPREIDPEVVPVLERYPWPGNVRELRNIIERMAILTPGDHLTVDAVPMEVRLPAASRPASGLQEVRDAAERERIRQALDQTDWNVSSAARLLGAERTSLHKRLRALGLKRR